MSEEPQEKSPSRKSKETPESPPATSGAKIMIDSTKWAKNPQIMFSVKKPTVVAASQRASATAVSSGLERSTIGTA